MHRHADSAQTISSYTGAQNNAYNVYRFMHYYNDANYVHVRSYGHYRRTFNAYGLNIKFTNSQLHQSAHVYITIGPKIHFYRVTLRSAIYATDMFYPLSVCPSNHNYVPLPVILVNG